uniref:Uncharacterized protein n=1 Tax=Opuntia streptacantha TaxID=393608 RepID=A0A7C8ZVS7_OPUST
MTSRGSLATFQRSRQHSNHLLSSLQRMLLPSLKTKPGLIPRLRMRSKILRMILMMDCFLEEYRKQRLAEMKEDVKVAKFGSIIPISGPDFIREVSQAPPEIWVVVLL